MAESRETPPLSGSQRSGQLATLVALLLGIAASTYLFWFHLNPAPDGLCGLSERVNCAGAAASPYAKVLGIPIALLGLAFYAGGALLFVRGARAPRGERAWTGGPALLYTLFGVALAYSIALAIISVVVIEVLCPFCVALYIANILGFVGGRLWMDEGPFTLLRRQASAPGAVVAEYGVSFAIVFVVVVVAGQVLGPVVATWAGGPALEPHAGSETVAVDSLRSDRPAAMGPMDAPVLIVEWSDFQCPHCMRLAASLTQVKEEFGDAVRVEFRHYPLPHHPHAEPAARAAYCAGEQDAFWPYHDLIFANQASLSRDALIRFSRQVGIDDGVFLDCLDDPRSAEAVVRDIEEGEALGVRGTPTFFINGVQYVGGWPYAQVARVVREELGR